MGMLAETCGVLMIVWSRKFLGFEDESELGIQGD
jgi:hypothetical protein